MLSLRFSKTTFLAALLLFVSILFTQSVAYATGSSVPTIHQDGIVEYKRFLQENYEINVSTTLTKGQFIEAVAKVLSLNSSGADVSFEDIAADDELFPAAAALYEQGILSSTVTQANQPLTNIVAVSIAVRAADLNELAYTYPAEKVERVLSKLHLNSSDFPVHVGQELAVAVDTGILPVQFQDNFAPRDVADSKFINALLGKVLITKGLYKQYLGYVNDHDIYAKVISAFTASDIIAAPNLQTLMNEALEQELVTGYSIKDARYEPHFIPSLSLAYGHSDLKHALQLIGLLRSEGLHAKVQLEPKTSAYVHLAEWGDPGPHVLQIDNGNYIAYSKEYDLQFEFATEADKEAFQDVILTYAKKNEADQTGLIYGSWWQPLYFSATEMQDYEIITNNLITAPNSTYYINTFSLNEDSARVVEGLKAIDSKVNINSYQFWVDKPFFNYLHGEAL